MMLGAKRSKRLVIALVGSGLYALRWRWLGFAVGEKVCEGLAFLSAKHFAGALTPDRGCKVQEVQEVRLLSGRSSQSGVQGCM